MKTLEEAARITALKPHPAKPRQGCVARRISRNYEWVWIGATIVLSFFLRLRLLNFESGDYRAFLSKWYDFLVHQGRWHGLGKEFASYPPLYLYLLSLSTLLPLPKLFAIKLISLASDYVAAWYVYRLVRVRSAIRSRRNSPECANETRVPAPMPSRAGVPRFPRPSTPWLAFTLFLFLPTVVMNSAVWGQCDIMYTACFLASLFYLLRERPFAALVAFGFACSLKPQAIFWCPLVASLLFGRVLKWRLLWVPAAVYLACAIPQILAGRPALHAVGHWARVGDYPGLTHGSVANWYQWVGAAPGYGYWWVGVGLTLAATASLVLWVWRKETRFNPLPRGDRSIGTTPVFCLLVPLALLSVLFPPFFLPGMHERYFFAADVLSLIYAFYVRGGWPVALLVQVASVFSYFPYLFNRLPIAPSVLALGTLSALVLVLWNLGELEPHGPGSSRCHDSISVTYE